MRDRMHSVIKTTTNRHSSHQLPQNPATATRSGRRHPVQWRVLGLQVRRVVSLNERSSRVPALHQAQQHLVY
jgi:hypothetical protein